MAAKGMTQAEIAALIGCCQPTLAKHFSNELARGRAKCWRDLITRKWTAASVGAILWLEQRMSGGDPGKRSADRRTERAFIVS